MLVLGYIVGAFVVGLVVGAVLVVSTLQKYRWCIQCRWCIQSKWGLYSGILKYDRFF